MVRLARVVCLAGLLCLAGLAVAPASAQGPIVPRGNPQGQNVLPAQGGPGGQGPQGGPQRGGPKGGPKGKGFPKGKGKGDPKGKALRQQRLAAQERVLERFLEMTPEQRVQALSGIQAARRQRLLGMLAEIDAMPVDEQQLLRGRYQQFLSLEMGRREALRDELQQLRGMSRAEIRQRLASPEAANQFTPGERLLLFEVAGQQAQE